MPLAGLEQIGAVDEHTGLEQVGLCGGSSGYTELDEKSESRISVAFWGICDLKYDPRCVKSERVKVLEFGDGRTSRFSHHGRPIKEKFDREFRMDATPIKRAVMTENKKFTHDMFASEGFAHLRPITRSYPKLYSETLHTQILSDMGARCPAVVLKLCNRSRGAGIVVAPAEELDAVLKRLLIPRSAYDLKIWLEAVTAEENFGRAFLDNMEEQCLHWWSNECPVFVVERCCNSIPVAKDEGGEDEYDGTMRVAWALVRKQLNKHQAEFKVAPLEITWLGGYWKLPQKPVGENGGSTLEGIHGRIVSSFNSVDKRTAPVSDEHLAEVYDILTPALPQIFSSGSLSVSMIMSTYREDELFRAFALARVAASMRITDMSKAQGLFELAQKKVPLPKKLDDAGLPERCLHSYIERNVAVCFAMQRDWWKAREGFAKALKIFPANATAYFLLGTSDYELGNYSEAEKSMVQSIALDPDFKQPHLGLGNCCLHLEKFHDAIEACLACLKRHPDAPVAQFIIGQALYHMAASSRRKSPMLAEEDVLRGRGALDLARRRVPEQWKENDQKMLDFLSLSDEERKQLKRDGMVPVIPIHGWKVHGWRP